MDLTIGPTLTTCSSGGAPGAGESSLRAAPGRGPRLGRVLVMDDEQLMREMLRRHLAVFGYETEAFADGRAAVDAYARAREEGRLFDAVILDWFVNGGWGGERTMAELLALDPGVKVMVCSGSLSGPDEGYLRQGFRAVLGKPYTLGELRLKLESMLA